MPGMSAQVEVLVNRVDNALVVPMRSVVRSLGKDCVLVATAEGAALREVQLGTSNYRLVEVVEGLREGEEVALAPDSLLSVDK
jgi:multidrug efflux pump subunit AcrA (membrane-fusion protein)